jgi:hypothetical protein
LQSWFDLGSNLEHDWVRRLDSYGVLLSRSPALGHATQTVFLDDEHWLAGASDAIVLKPGTNQAHCVEIKTTGDDRNGRDKVRLMLDSNGADLPKQHAKYLRQLGAYIGLANASRFSPQVTVCKKSGLIARPVADDDPYCDCVCPARMLGTDRPHVLLHAGECDLERVDVLPPTDGTLIYSSREDPLTVASFRVVHDPAWMQAGLAKLAAWKQAFLDERIPEHPHEGQRAKWSVEPCQWCSAKKWCKLDYQQQVTSLRDSNLIGFSEGIAPAWSYEERRNAVIERWAHTQSREEITAA